MNSVERVKQICKQRKIPIYKLEKDLGFANGYIGQLKKGTFPDNRLAQIAEYLNVDATYLMGGEEIKNPATDGDGNDSAKLAEFIDVLSHLSDEQLSALLAVAKTLAAGQ